MLLHTYLEGILGSKVKIKVLRVMYKFPTKVFTGRELAGHIKEVSHMAVSKSLKDMIGMNLISVEYHGASQLLSLNKNSYLFKPLKELFNIEEETLNYLIKRIRLYFLNQKYIKSIVLFGSIVKGEELVNSDIDLLMIATNKKIAELKIAEKQREITKIFGNVISPYIMSVSEFEKKKKNQFIKNVKRSHILVLGNEI